MDNTDVTAALRSWRDGLVNLSGVNRALNFKHTKTGTVAITAPSMVAIMDGLRRGQEWAFRGEPDGDAAEVGDRRAIAVTSAQSPVLQCRKSDKDLGAALRNLARRAQAEFVDRGLAVLYVGLGALKWRDVDGSSYMSPLVLVPVQLVARGSKELPRLRLGEEDPALNPALALRLSQFNVTLPMIEDLADLDVLGLLAKVEAAVEEQVGWEVTQGAVLSAFSFQKEAMYRDLLANEGAVLGSPLARALANQDPATQDPALLFEPIDPDDIDEMAPAESLPLVLDADSSQRACIAAAVGGRSLVMDGPPGTGKSQTIANMIGALMHAGKSVLFVSEKAAALEVVRNRLTAAGLGNYLLELHSHKASRKEVAAQLFEALTTIPQPPAGMDGSARRSLAEHRRKLTAYAEAMNRVREPLGLSLHDVLGRLAELADVPSAPIPAGPISELTRDAVEEVRDAAQRLERAWGPASQRWSFLWRDVIEEGSLDLKLGQAQSSLEQLLGTSHHNSTLVDEFSLHRLSDLSLLVELLDLAERRPAAVLESWLTADDLGPTLQAQDDLNTLLHNQQEAAAAVRGRAGVSWTELPRADGWEPTVERNGVPVNSLDIRSLTAVEARLLAASFWEEAAMLGRRLTSVDQLTKRIGLPPVETHRDIDIVLYLAGAAYATHRPERAWLSDQGLAAARHARAALQIKTRQLAEAEQAARPLFTDAALGQPLADLQERFSNVHRGLRKLSGSYRRDKRTVAAFTAEVATLEEAISDLSLAVKWSAAVGDFGEAERSLGPALGAYWRGRATDYAALDAALEVADQVVHFTPPVSASAVVEHVVSPRPESALQAVVKATWDDLRAWRSGPTATGTTHRPELLLVPVSEAIAWLEAQSAALGEAADRVESVDRVVGRRMTVAEAAEVMSLGELARAAAETLALQMTQLAGLLGNENVRRSDAHPDELERALAWAQEARSLRDGRDNPLTAGQVKALKAFEHTPSLGNAYQHWQRSCAAIQAAFGPLRQLELEAELDDPASAKDLLAELREDSSGQSEWFAYQEALADLRRHDLEAAVDFCTEQQLHAEGVVNVIMRALLRAWADTVINVDRDLRPARTEDRDLLVEQFRELDRQVILAATGEIVSAVNGRRPTKTDVGESAVIRREGLKKSRHLPVRELIKRTQSTVHRLKPCFMMSPLAVSQYLPSEMRFDVVIFDEASQVTPGDAVNCVYRARALITAGDDRQLPPTSFFDRMTDGEENEDTDVADFQSVLELSKASGGFRNLGLRWHYRSRHENLIAFSNQKFYEGKLVTYPGALSEGPNVGVELFHVPGQYRRGTTRDNPIEADAVVARVIHHFTTRPHASLGVVSFSVAQADAIQAALERATDRRPDLAKHLSDDRLNGFFIKSLESVQGDERDVMIFSIGYGPDEVGKVTTNFGALNKSKGWRRLNVAITRARERVEVVSSLRAGDIPPTDNESVRHLVAYLDFAERGTAALALPVASDGRDTDSPFEDSVLAFVRSLGHTAVPQVGAAGYRIDMGVRHPEHPGVFSLGIECDGYMYHSSRAARDRDRLREEVLAGLGWRLHRIWGTDWYRNRRQEEERLRHAIEESIKAPVVGRLTSNRDWLQREVVELAPVVDPAIPSWAIPYRLARVPRLPGWTDPSEPGASVDMRAPIQALVEQEGPIHLDLLMQRLRDAWGIGRVGQRIRSNIEAAVRRADVVVVDDFVDVLDRPSPAIRVPSAEGGQRTVGQVPEVELRGAILHLLEAAGVSQMDELLTSISRLFGWNRRGTDIGARLSSVLQALSRDGLIAIEQGSVRRTDT